MNQEKAGHYLGKVIMSQTSVEIHFSVFTLGTFLPAKIVRKVYLDQRIHSIGESTFISSALEEIVQLVTMDYSRIAIQ